MTSSPLRRTSVLLLVLVLASCGMPAPSTAPGSPPPPSSPDGSPSASAAPSASPAPPSLAWRRLPIDPSVFDGAVVMRLVAGDDLLVAFGRDIATLDPITWTSKDGVAWTRHPQPPGAFGGGVPDAAVVTPGGVIALGWDPRPTATGRETWVSPDGAAWTRGTFASGRIELYDAALVERGGVVLLTGGGADEPILLRSTDGRRWLDLREADPLSEGQGAQVVATDTGFAAVAQTGSKATFWSSADGLDWTPLGERDWLWIRIAWTEAGFVGIGDDNSTGNTTSRGWWSSDGGTWVSAGMPASIPVSDFRTALLPIDGGAVVLGSTWEETETEAIVRPVAAVTRDGTHWAGAELPMPDLRAASMRDLSTVSDGHVFVTGWDAESDAQVMYEAALADRVPSPWPEPPAPPAASPSPAPTVTPIELLAWTRMAGPSGLTQVDSARIVRFGGRLVLTAVTGARTVAWTSDDAGLTWRRGADQRTLEGARILDLAVTGQRLVAVGAIGPSQRTPRPTAAAWTSPDGVRWTRADGSLGRGEARGVAADGAGRLVAVGVVEDPEVAERPIAWTSADGRTWTAARPIDPAGGSASSVVAGGPGWIAGGGESRTAMIWTSPDGVTWSRIPDGSAFVVPGTDWYVQGSVTGIARDPAGGYVAVGTIAQGGVMAESVGAVFRSPDGVAWTRLPDEDWIRAITPAAVAGSVLGVVFAGTVLPGWSFIGLSADGGSFWPADRLDLRGGDAGLDATVSDLAWLDDRGVAIGSLGPYGAPASLFVAAPPSVLVPDAACPSGALAVRAIAALSAAQRMACLAGRTLTLRAWVHAEMSGCGAPADGAAAEPGALDDVMCGPWAYLSDAADGERLLEADVATERAFDRLASRDGWYRVRIRFGSPGPQCYEPPSPAAEFPVAHEPLSRLRYQCAGAITVMRATPAR